MSESPFTLRHHEPADIAWVIQRHGEIYTEEYGWDSRFSNLVEQIALDFVRDFDSSCERCWIAERAGERIGCVFLVRKSEDIAQLRLLLVDPRARGLGVGRKLVQECIDFASAHGYGKMRLWTNDVLTSARRIYEAAGFILIEEEEHASWGKTLTSQTWELDLETRTR
jgi:GNAT superfamily N-acetyltransferase